MSGTLCIVARGGVRVRARVRAGARVRARARVRGRKHVRAHVGALILAAGLLPWTGCGAEGDRSGFVVMPEMVERVSYGAFDPNEVTADGKTLLLPPEGTVPYGHTAFLYGPGEDEAVRAGQELFQPLEPTRENLARGRQVYAAACAVCHGGGGRGDGPIIGRFPNPPSLLADRAMTLPDGYLLHVVVHGQGIMAPHGAHVRGEDRWRLVMYLRQMQGLDPAGVMPSGGSAPDPSSLQVEETDVQDAGETEDADAPGDADASGPDVADDADAPEAADAPEDADASEAAGAAEDANDAESMEENAEDSPAESRAPATPSPDVPSEPDAPSEEDAP